MTTADLRSLGNVMMQKGGNLTTQKTEEAQEVLASSFSNLMDQIQSSVKNANMEVSAKIDVKAGVKGKEDGYGNYRYQDTANKFKTAKGEKIEEKIGKVKETVETVAQEMKSKISDACEVAEERIAKVMEELGLNFIDLLNPENLAKLFTELTGEQDVTALLVNDDFQQLMVDMNTMMQELVTGLGMDKEELTELVSMMETIEEPEEVPEEFKDLFHDLGSQKLEQVENTGELEKPVVEVELVTDEEVEEKPVEEVKEETEEVESLFTETSEAKDTTKKVGTEDRNQSHNQGESDHSPQTGNVSTSGSEPISNLVSENTTSFTQTVDMMEMIERLAENIKATISSTSQTMEMQLNPEHLGKLFLQVTQKEGAVSAQITAQSEQVKEALLTQVAELQDKLNQAGVKVTAIEITVSAHAFERNLEQDQRQQENQDNASHSGKGRRNLNLNDLDELSGLMSEEEALVAQMMRDNGNSVDLTA